MFRYYDIRGLVGSELNAETVRRIAHAYAADLHDLGLKSVCVGRDARDSSSEFESITIQALVDSGLDVVSIGLMPTPAAHFTIHHMDLDSLVVITASHNPLSYNGLKFCLKDRPYFGDDIVRLKNLYDSGANLKGEGTRADVNIAHAYLQHLLSVKTVPKKVIWDAGTGACAGILHHLIENLPGQHKIIHSDGFLDPSRPEEVKALSQAVIDQGFDLGLAFDGDGDRLGVVDAKGRHLKGDQLLSFFAQHIAQPGDTVVGEIKSSLHLTDKLKQLRLNPILGQTGYPHIKKAMTQHNAILGGEVSGHFFFKDHHQGYDDGLYSAMRLLQIDESLTKWFDDYPPSYVYEQSYPTKHPNLTTVKDQLQSHNVCFNTTDGLRVETKNNWWLIRQSNTQDALYTKAEGRTEADLNEAKHQLVKALELMSVFPEP